MARTKYPGTCYRCGGRVNPGFGHFQRVRPGEPNPPAGKWRAQHTECAIYFRGTQVGITEPRRSRPTDAEYHAFCRKREDGPDAP